jgi:hypothetical protein
MELRRGSSELEELNVRLNNEEELSAYKARYDDYVPALIPRLLGHSLVWCGNVVYGKRPSYLKFRAVEVIARVPYHSWTSVAYTLLTLFYANEKKAKDLSHTALYAELAQENETMHVIVISQLARQEKKTGTFRHTLIPLFFAFFYFWASYLLYVIKPRYSYELNYLFENHAFDQYSEFIQRYEESLKKKPMSSAFLDWYGRHPKNQYEFFRSVRNDEIIHRNTSIEALEK